MKSSLAAVATALGLPWGGEECDFERICIDSRHITPGCLFIALKGEQFDGHDFVKEASKQAAACLVSQSVDSSAPLLVVNDTLEAMTQMAAWWRKKYTGPVLAITGSCGKTTTRSLLSALMASQGSVHASIKSHNNHIGVPLTLLGIRSDHDSVVAEVGTSGPGEIVALADIIQATIAIITLAAPVHLDGLGSLAGIVEEKGALVRSLKSGGVAILNADDPAFEQWKEMLLEGVRLVSFGAQSSADITVTKWKSLPNARSRARLSVMGETVDIEVPMVGEHHATNVAAACAAAYAAGVPMSAMPEALASAVLPPNRLVPKSGFNGAYLIDDTYNANPLAVSAAIKVLMSSPQAKKVLVLGDMGELGDQVESLHASVGLEARDLGVDRLFAYGEAMKHAVAAFGDGAQHFETKQSLLEALHEIMDADTVVLIKGSRFMRMEEITQGCVDLT